MQGWKDPPCQVAPVPRPGEDDDQIQDSAARLLQIPFAGRIEYLRKPGKGERMRNWIERVSWAIATVCLITGSAAPASAGMEAPTSSEASTNKAKTDFMFVQTATRGTFKPVGKGETDEYILTLNGVSSSTIYFSDRPERIAGGVSLEKFVKTFPFGAANPPNAAVTVVVPGKEQQQSVVIVELTEPEYNARRGTLTYHAKVIGERPPGLNQWTQAVKASLPASFDEVSVFIDDCPDAGVTCWGADGGSGCPTACGALDKKVGYCWNTWSMACQPCNDYGYLCSEDNICNNCGNGPECCGSCTTFHQSCR